MRKKIAVIFLILGLSVSLGYAQFGGIKGALECGTIGNIGLDRCKEDPTPIPTSQYSCENGGSEGGLQGLEQAIGDGMRNAGFESRDDSITVFKSSSGLVCFAIRLNADGNFLPSMSCIADHIANGNVKEGTVIGAKTMIFGCIQQSGNQTRTTAREVDVETGVVGETGKGDAPGTDEKSIRKSVESAFKAFKDNMS